MIIYREHSSLETDLGCSAKMLYSLSNTINSHYHETSVPKGNGEYRKLFVPDEELKAVQKKITNVILNRIELSPYATAYRFGGSPLKNAKPHAGHAMLLKLDIRHFFDKITYALVRNIVFNDRIFSESNGVLLSVLCCYKGCLPQGAPSSPAISNIIMRDFDNTVGSWCRERGITYTRYCDDMTFSGVFEPSVLKCFVSGELGKLGFFLNEKKTVCVCNGQKMSVTGIVVNQKPNVAASYRKNVRQEMYYCKKYGIRSHLEKKGNTDNETVYLRKLLGRINYVLSVDPNNSEFIGYKTRIKEKLCGKTTDA